MGITIFEKIENSFKNIDSYSNKEAVPSKHLQKCKYLYFWVSNGIRLNNKIYYISIDFYITFIKYRKLDKFKLKLKTTKPFQDKGLDTLLNKIINQTHKQILIFTITSNLEEFRRCLVSFMGYEKMMNTFYKIRKHVSKAEQHYIFYCKQDFPDEK